MYDVRCMTYEAFLFLTSYILHQTICYSLKNYILLCKNDTISTMKILTSFLAIGFAISTMFNAQAQVAKNTYSIDVQVKTKNGILEGEFDTRSKVASFKGIPFALPPVGELRWKAPQEPKSWSGVLQAKQFGPKAVETPIFGDMGFRSNGMSEDCLYLNVWSPNPKEGAKLPVLVYFYGGGFMAGDGSEPRYD